MIRNKTCICRLKDSRNTNLSSALVGNFHNLGKVVQSHTVSIIPVISVSVFYKRLRKIHKLQENISTHLQQELK